MTTIAEIRTQFPMYSDVPDGELVRAIHGKFYADMPYAAFLKNIDFRKAVDPTEGMSGGQKFLAGAGKAFTDIGRGARQIVSSDAPTMSGLVTGDKRSAIQQEIDEARELERPLMKTGAGVAGNISGNVAAFAPTAFIPGVNTYAGAALTGATMGAIQPTATGESRAANTGAGALFGLGGQAVGNLAGRIIRPVASRLSPEQQALAQAAEREGIPLTAGQATGSRPLQVTESVMENLPLTSGSQLAGREAQQRAFTAAALKRAGMVGDVAEPAAMAAQKQVLGNRIGQIAEQNTLDFYKQGTGAQLITRLDSILTEAEKRGQTASEPIREIVMNIVNEIGQTGQMSGRNYQAWRQMLRPLSEGGGADAHAFSQIRQALDRAFNEQIATTGGAPAWTEANRQYANLKTLLQAAGGPGAPAASSQIAPTQLAAALRQSVGKEGVALGRSDLNELSRIGTTFVRDQIPNSGTAQRQLVQALLTGGGGAGVGMGTAAAMGRDPLEGAKWGAGIGATALVAPRVAQVLMNSPVMQAYLKRGLAPMSEAQRELLVNALRTGALGSMPALTQQ